MESKENYFTRTRFIAFFIILTMIMNMFSPYITYATTTMTNYEDGEPYLTLSIREVQDIKTTDEDDWTDETYYYYYDYYQGDVTTTDNYSGTRVIFIDIIVNGSDDVKSAGINLLYDDSILIPAEETYTGSGKNKVYTVSAATDYKSDAEKVEYNFAEISWGIISYAGLNTTTKQFMVDGTLSGGTWQDAPYTCCTMMFMLADGVTLDDVTTDALTITATTGLDSGLEIRDCSDHTASSMIVYSGETYLTYSGFASSSKVTVSSIAVKTDPTKLTYYYGETLDLTDGVITVTYSDGTTEDIDMADALASGDLTLSSTVADGTCITTITYGDETTTWEYYELTGISVYTNPTTMSYEHGDTLDFSGGEILRTYTNANNGDTKNITLDINEGLTSGDLTVDMTTADYDNPTVTFTYHGYTATLTFTVTDPIASISITTLPTTVEYDDNDPIDFSGGAITAVTKSGKTSTVNMTSSDVTKSDTTADISKATEKWTTTSQLTAGYQPITLTYEGLTATYNITVNDTVSGLTITTQPTATNYYGTEAGALDFSGLVATVTTSGGGSFQIDADSLTIDTTGYDKTSLSTQYFSATYGSLTSTNDVEITLSNYVTGIDVTFTETTFDYGTTLADAIANATYKYTYADGTTDSTGKALTASMVSGYNSEPNYALMSNLQYTETLTISDGTYSTTQSITIVDKLDSVSILYYPLKTSYIWGESLAITGTLEVTYKSGYTTTVSIGNTNYCTVTEMDGTTVDMEPDASKLTNGSLTKDLKVTYTDDNGDSAYTTYAITITDEVKQIVMATNPDTLIYNYGEQIDTTNGTITVTYTSGNTATVSLDKANVVDAKGSETLTTLGTQDLTVTYGGATTTYEVKVVDYITGITLSDTALTGTCGDALSDIISSLTYTPVWASGAAGTSASVTTSMISTAFDTTSVGSQTLTVEYTDAESDSDSKSYGTTLTADFTVTLSDTLKSVTVDNAPSTLKYGESLDLSSATITAKYGSGNKTVDPQNVTVIWYEESTTNVVNTIIPGTYDVTVTYDGVESDPFTVTVQDYVTGISLDPSSVKGTYGDTLAKLISDNSITYTVTYAYAGDQTAETLLESMVSSYDSSTVQTQSLTVTYTDKDTSSYTNGTDFTATLTVELSDDVVGVAITVPSKTSYNYGDSLDLSGGYVTVTYASQQTKQFDLTSDMVTEGGSTVDMSPTSGYTNNELTKTLTVSYTDSDSGESDTQTYNITIRNNVLSISIYTDPSTLTYNVNDQVNLTDGEIKITRATGTPEVISMGNSSVTITDEGTATEGSKTATVTFTDDNGDKVSTTVGYTVTNTVSSISIDSTAQTVYKYKDTINGTITATMGDGTTKTIDLTDSSVTVTGFDSSELGQESVTVEYEGIQTTFTVTVLDYVTGITLNKSSVAGTYGDTLAQLISDKSITYTVTYAKAGDQTAETLLESMVSSYNSNTVQTQNLTVTYTDKDTSSYTNGTDFTATLTVTLKDTVVSVSVTAPTSDQTYNYGDSLDLDGATITLTYASAGTNTVPPTASMVTEYNSTDSVDMEPDAADFTNNKLTKTVTLSYTDSDSGVSGSVDYSITIINDVQSIEMQYTPKTTYDIGDTLDLSNGSILVNRATGDPEGIDLSNSSVTVTGFDNTSEGTQKLTVSYTENGITKETYYYVTVTDSITGITMAASPDTDTYYYGDSLDLTGASIYVWRNSGAYTEVTVTSSMVSGYSSTTLGTQTITVTYEGFTTTFTVKVEDYVTDIILVAPTKLTYVYGETLDLTGGSVQRVMASGEATSAVDLTTYNVTVLPQEGTILNYGTGKYTIDVTYYGITKSFSVTVTDTVTAVTVTAPTSDQTYNYGDSLDLDGATITLTYASAGTSTVTPDASMVTEYGTSDSVNMKPDAADFTDNKLTKTVTLSYTDSDSGVSGSVDYSITIINDVQKISVYSTTHKTSYNVNDSLDITDLEILVTRATGDPEVKSVTSDMVSTLDSSTEGTKTITISYTENGITKTTDYNVTVTNTVSSISIDSTAQTVYKYKDTINGTITATMGDGTTKTIDLTDSSVTVTGFDSSELGQESVTVEYEGIQTTFTVTIQDYVTGITLNKSSVAGTYGDTLAQLINDNSITYTVTYAKAGAQTAETLLESMVSSYNSNTVQTQSLTVTYTDKDTSSYTNGTDFTATLTVELSDDVVNVAITVPSKTSYNYGDSLDLSGGYVLLTYASAETKQFDLTSDMVTESGSTVNMSPDKSEFTNNVVTKTLTVSYTDSDSGNSDTKTYDITIRNNLVSIEVRKGSTIFDGNGNVADTYNVNDTINLSTGMIWVYRATGRVTTPVTIGNDNRVSISAPDGTATAGTYTATITFTDDNGDVATVDVSYTVVDSVKSVTVTNPPTAAKYGENLDLSNSTITATWGSGDKTVDPQDVTINNYDSSTLGTQTVYLTYEGVDSNSFTVEVKDYVKEITLSTASIKGKYGDTLATLISDNTLQYTVDWACDSDVTAALDETMISAGFSSTDTNLQSLTVSYEDTNSDSYTFGQTITATLEITLVDNIYSMTLNNAPSTADYGKDLDLSNTTITITSDQYPNGTTIQVTKDMISGYNPTDTSGAQTVTVTYDNGSDQKTATFQVTVGDYVTGYKLTAPSKTSYKYGESLELTDCYITEVWASGASTASIPVTDSMISGYDSTKEGTQTVTVTYNGETIGTFGVTVTDAVTGIELVSTPKTSYNYGESLDVSGGTITVTKESGNTETISITSSMVTGYNSNTLGTQTVTVTYEECTAEYQVTVSDYVESISIVYPDKLVYNLNEDLDLTNGSVTTIMASGATGTTVAMDSSMISGFDSSTVGSKVLTVTYEEKSTSFGIVVRDPYASMVIEKLPDKLEYLIGESLDLTGGTVTLTTESGETSTISMSDAMVTVTGFDSSSAGTKELTVTVTYTEDITYTQQVETQVYNDETQEYETVITEETVTEQQVFTETATFTVNVSDYEVGAVLTAPSKTTYEYGEDLDLTGGSMKIVMASGAVKEEVSLAAYMIDGFNSKQVGTQTITVTYKGYTKTFTITVVDSIGGISLGSEPDKTQYDYGESLDLTGGTIKVIRTSGTEEISITSDMISGYDPNVAGYQVVTVTYEGFTTQFVVYVYPEETADTTDSNSSSTSGTTTTVINQTIYTNNTPKRTTANTKTTNTTTEVEPEETVEEVIEEEPEETEEVEEVVEEEKQTLTLGEKDVNEETEPEEDSDNSKKAAVAALLGAAIILLLLLISKKNTKIYVTEDGEYVLGGKIRLTKDDPTINVNEYLDGETYVEPVKIVLNDSISEKLDGKEITIKHRDRVIKYKVKYEDEPVEIILEKIQKESENDK